MPRKTSSRSRSRSRSTTPAKTPAKARYGRKKVSAKPSVDKIERALKKATLHEEPRRSKHRRRKQKWFDDEATHVDIVGPIQTRPNYLSPFRFTDMQAAEALDSRLRKEEKQRRQRPIAVNISKAGRRGGRVAVITEEDSDDVASDWSSSSSSSSGDSDY